MLKSKTKSAGFSPLNKHSRKQVDTPCGRTGIAIGQLGNMVMVIFSDKSVRIYKQVALKAPLITSRQRQQLKQNFIHSQAIEEYNPKPVVKLFNPYGSHTWLLSEMDPENPNITYGLADLGMACVEWGSIDLNEIRSIYMTTELQGNRICVSINCAGKGIPAIERDLHFKPHQGIWDYMKQYNDMDCPSITA